MSGENPVYVELAQKYLVKARAATGNTRRYFANLCQVCLAKEGKSPADIGTTQQELTVLSLVVGKKKKSKTQRMQQGPKELCMNYLDQCRNAKGASRQYYANLCLATLAKYNLAPADIETSQAELDELQKKGFVESAVNYLNEARNVTGARRKCYADLCWEYLGKANAFPEEIGSSEEELSEMASGSTTSPASGGA